MMRLSAFADEISADLDEQIAVLNDEGIAYIDVRSVWGINVLDLTDQEVGEIKRMLAVHGISVASIGSPIGKVPIDYPFDEHMRRFERAITVAKALGTPLIRMFSFYPPLMNGQTTRPDPSTYRSDVLERLQEMTRRAQAAGVTLMHENEKDIYGDTIERNVDLLQSINNPHFLSVLDPANYLQCAQVPYPTGYKAIRPWLSYIHVKDVCADGTMAVAGDGEANWPALLQDLHKDGYNGFIAVEPHLAVAEKYQGFSGPDLFCQASQALQRLLREMRWEYQ